MPCESVENLKENEYFKIENSKFTIQNNEIIILITVTIILDIQDTI